MLNMKLIDYLLIYVHICLRNGFQKESVEGVCCIHDGDETEVDE